MKRTHKIMVLIICLGYFPIQISASIPEYVYLNGNGILDDAEYNTLLKRYGQPKHDLVKPRHKFVGEYYIGIENKYPSTNPEFKNIPIKEMFWNINPDLNLTCWLHHKNGKWTVITYVFWGPGAQF
jgi:hypothetical protein